MDSILNAETLAILETEVDAMITRRILRYHQSLIDNGQIREVALNPPASDYSLSEHTHSDDLSEGLAPLQGGHSQQTVCGNECE
jgi:hypothetical protein